MSSASDDLIDLGSRRELFVDRHIIEELVNAQLKLQQPQPREIAIRHDKPWEGPFCLYDTIIRDGDRFLMYYRGWQVPDDRAVYCVAESTDGVHFERPNLGMHAWDGDTNNNIFLAEEPYTHTFAPFLDQNPQTKEDQRFKAFARDFQGERCGDNAVLKGFASADGINWQLIQQEPVITDGIFDSQNVGFWSEAEKKYVAYYRTFKSADAFASGTTGATTQTQNLRCIMRATSDDFINWEPGTLMDYRTKGQPAPVEEFYINQTRPYFRAPHIYVALPARFMGNRPAITEEQGKDIGVHDTQLSSCSDACFMTTRPGRTFYDRTFMEGFVRPRTGPGHWSGRCNYPADGVVRTGPDEMSFYVDEHYAQPHNQLRRYSLRLDGFSSVHASHSGGELVTKPLSVEGAKLELNYETSAAGSLRVEIRDENNQPLPGFTLEDADDVFGNKIAGRATWNGNSSIENIEGQPIRLRIAMRDADLFSLQFVE